MHIIIAFVKLAKLPCRKALPIETLLLVYEYSQMWLKGITKWQTQGSERLPYPSLCLQESQSDHHHLGGRILRRIEQHLGELFQFSSIVIWSQD